MLEILSIKLYWYGFMYALSFIIIDYLVITAAKNKKIILDVKTSEKFTLYILISAIVGGRLGYVIFYDFSYYISNITKILFLWEGGMSFHGGLIGAMAGSAYMAKKKETRFLDMTDIISLYAPIGLFFGRIGNFINSELYGIQTSNSWGVIFTTVDDLPRHPSMLYEAFLEGFVLFIILMSINKKNVKSGVISGSFLLFYGIFRFIVEFVRLPDAHIGYIYYDWVTMGHLLTIPMIGFGLVLIYKKI